MPSKKEYEEVFNQFFGVSIKWSKLTKEELASLATVLNNPEAILERLGQDVKKRVFRGRILDLGREVAEEFVAGWDGPFARFMRRVLGVEKKSEE